MNFHVFAWGCIALLSCQTLDAQEEIRWGKIPPEDLKMTSYPLDTSAEALVLADIGTFDYNLHASDQLTELRIHRRIKILKRSGFDQGDIEITYSSKNQYQDIVQLKAQIFHPDGSKFSVEKKDFFEEKTAEGLTTIKFTFPEIKVGSIIEYTYVKQIKDWVRIPDWYFQSDIPVRLSEFTLTIPEFLEFVILTRGRPLDRNEQSFDDSTIGTTARTRRYVLGMKDAPGLKRESFITTMRDYLAHVSFQLSGTLQDGVRKPYLSDWPTVAKELIDAENFGRRIDRKANFKAVLDKVSPIVAAANTPEDKLKAIYHFITEHIKWDGDYGSIYVIESLDKIFEQKKGDVADINLLLVALLKEFGFNAKPMLISTRDHGRHVDLYPILSQFNYVVAHVTHNEKVYVLDATDPNRPMGFPGEDALNEKGWIVDPVKPQWTDIKPGRAFTTRMFNLSLDPEGKASGKYTSVYEGYAAIDIREELSKKEETKAVEEADHKEDEEVSVTTSKVEYDSVVIRNLEDIYKPLAFNAKVSIAEGGTVNGDFLYFNPIIHPAFAENPFKQTVREYPVDIAYPLSHRFIINLTIPEGYEIEQIPEQVSLALPNNGGKFTFLVSKPAGTTRMIQINSSILINQVHYEPEEYLAIKKFFDLIIEKQQEQLVLKKS
ncbi:DUF3857 domain-containing transglutaminase family protein [Haliscomenobacter hydrossis]|uniref:Transglutaminase domain-containing protein n=1 Tax=Haliscomenobacter hydrossis (strain ATCC 27775 / DSM 1100 / LMG 10767 / O) TaxID=760192 RepID=F4KWW9_HALH1|nr:DUF3857 and transglutaminase domain-containing protein [Haliscomenobacter hydrossis]AEE53569.1 transglutaminase domain-containing protein [Haliscomenobacter hydrossis DSM 1100]